MKKKTIAGIMAFVLLIGAGVGVTLAYLSDKTENVVNTFTVGKVDIDLWEHTVQTAQDGTKSLVDPKVLGNTTDYKIIPGGSDPKDPTVEVIAGSEACWVFIQIVPTNNAVTGNNNATEYVSYVIDTGWTELTNPGVDGKVYYRTVDSLVGATGNTLLNVLKDKQVVYDPDLTSTDLKAITDAKKPTLTFTAYAVQQANVADVNAAWTAAKSAAIENTQTTSGTNSGTGN